MDVETRTQKKSLITGHIPVRPLIAGIFLSAVFFLLFAANSQGYRSTVSIIVIAKSPTAALQKDIIAQNITSLAHTLNYYDRLLADHPSIQDPTVGFAPDKRKAIWGDYIKAHTVDSNGRSLIELSVLAKTPKDAQILSQDAAQSLFSLTSNYYDVKNDIDLRIIDGPIPSTVIDKWQWLALLSVILGFAATFVGKDFFNSPRPVLLGGKDFFQQSGGALRDFGKGFLKSKEKPLSTLEDIYLSEEQNIFEAQKTDKKQATPPAHLPVQEKPTAPTGEIKEWEYPNFPEMPIRHVPTASAPDNLPIAEDHSFMQQSEQPFETPSEHSIAPEAPEVKNTEPTQEEIKNRLNQLLKGEL